MSIITLDSVRASLVEECGAHFVLSEIYMANAGGSIVAYEGNERSAIAAMLNAHVDDLSHFTITMGDRSFNAVEVASDDVLIVSNADNFYVFGLKYE